MSARLTITRVGPATTIQDAGRFGMLRHGISESGPMDRGAFRRAGALLGRAGGEAIEFSAAGLEFTLEGGAAKAAFAGGSFSLRINGAAMAWPACVHLHARDRVEITPGPAGNYGYARFDQGIDVPPVLGSRSTNLVAGLGGLDNRALRAGDVLMLRDLENGTAAKTAPAAASEGPIRVIWGLHADLFSPAVRQAFLETPFCVSRRLDRMGVRLDDPAGVFAGMAALSLVSDAVVAGDIQILGDGTPIVLMRDHQPTGGYPRIATVISADLDRLAQMRPGTELAFRPVTLHKAREHLLAAETTMTSLDLNADLGEGMSGDAALLDIVSSASIACGGHAGTEASIRAALAGAREKGVVAGAHPGFADPEHFGRRRLELGADALTRQMREQLEAIGALAAAEGVRLRYVKLHGALANMAAEDEHVASIAFAAVRNFDHGLAILAIDHSAQVAAAEALGLRVIREAYADRAYQPNGLLVPRSAPGAVLHDADRIAERAIALAERGELTAADGTVFASSARSLCLHGDNEAAVTIARALKARLNAAGITIAPAL